MKDQTAKELVEELTATPERLLKPHLVWVGKIIGMDLFVDAQGILNSEDRVMIASTILKSVFENSNQTEGIDLITERLSQVEDTLSRNNSRNRQTEDVGAEDGASEKPAPQEEVSGKQADTSVMVAEEAANQIVHEYKWRIIHEISDMLTTLDASLSSADVVMGRRRALIDIMHLLEERNWYRAYTLAGVSQMTVNDLVAPKLKPTPTISNPPSDAEIKQKIEYLLAATYGLGVGRTARYILENCDKDSLIIEHIDTAAAQLLDLMKGSK